MPLDVSKSQAMVAAEAIPILQTLMKTCPPNFHEKIEILLSGLPGCLTVSINRANNLKQVMGGTNAFCRLRIGNGPARRTKVLILVSKYSCPGPARHTLLYWIGCLEIVSHLLVYNLSDDKWVDSQRPEIILNLNDEITDL